MLAIARFEVPLATSDEFVDELEAALAALADCEGYLDGEIGQNLDDPTIWVLMTKWKNVGSYRRALSAMRSKLEAIPVLARAIDEPGAYDR
jgi:quinol monooxygenase YgiN